MCTTGQLSFNDAAIGCQKGKTTWVQSLRIKVEFFYQILLARESMDTSWQGGKFCQLSTALDGGAMTRYRIEAIEGDES